MASTRTANPHYVTTNQGSFSGHWARKAGIKAKILLLLGRESEIDYWVPYTAATNYTTIVISTAATNSTGTFTVHI